MRKGQRVLVYLGGQYQPAMVAVPRGKEPGTIGTVGIVLDTEPNVVNYVASWRVNVAVGIGIQQDTAPA